MTRQIIQLFFIFSLISCDSDNSVHPSQLKRDGPIHIKESKYENFLLGTWMLDSVTENKIDNPVSRVNSKQGYIFKENGEVNTFEEIKGSLKIFPHGSYSYKNNILTVKLENNFVQKWKAKNDNQSGRLILEGDFYIVDDKKPVLFLSKKR